MLDNNQQQIPCGALSPISQQRHHNRHVAQHCIVDSKVGLLLSLLLQQFNLFEQFKYYSAITKILTKMARLDTTYVLSFIKHD
jgi:hypothetical protein